MSKAKVVKCPDCGKNFRMLEKEYETMKDFKGYLSLKCPQSDEHYIIQLRKKINKIPVERKQEILDLMHTGLTVGQVIGLLKMDFDVVSHIICDNIGSYSYLNKEATP